MRGFRWWSALLVALLVLFLASEALAQRRRTGGSFGGGSFGRRSQSSRSGSSSWGSGSRSGSSSWGSGSRSGSSRWGSGSRSGSSRWGSGSRRYGSTTGGGTYGGSRSYARSGRGCAYGGMGTGLCFVLVVGGLLVLVIVARRRKGVPSVPSGPPSYAGLDSMHVSELRLAIDWRARREIQDTLRRLAETGDTQTSHGLAHLLRETVLALRRAEMSWLYVSQSNQGPMAPTEAQGRFAQLATAARSAFQHELVRGAHGHVHREAGPAQSPTAAQGEGVVVVSLIVAAYRPLQALQQPDANQLRMALDNRAALTAEQLAAIEVVWSPAADDDRMSTAELEQLYPDLALIDPESIAGRIFCSYCRGPFAMELLTCPHCGAPAEASRGNRAPPRGG